jgi:PBP1b-binding outer membrane lipoprotein LpoB
MKKLICAILTILLTTVLLLGGCKAKEQPAEPNTAAKPAPTAPK